MSIQEILPLIIPILIIQLVLMALALVDLFKEERQVKGSNKPLWALVIVFINIIGPLAYFFVGREDA